MRRSINLVFPAHINFVIVLIGILLFFYLLVIGANILVPLAYSLLISLFMLPLCKRMERGGLSRSLAILICILLLVAVIFVLFTLLYSNVLSFSEDLPRMDKRVKELIRISQQQIEHRFKMDSQKQLSWLNDNMDGFLSTGGSLLNGLLQATTTFFTYLLFIPIYVFFMLYYRHILKNFIHQILDFEHLDRAAVIEQEIQTVTQRYIVGLVTVITIIATLNIIGLWIIGIRHALFFGILAAFLTIIPYVGVLVGSLLPIVFALVSYDSLFYPIAVYIWFQLVQTIEGNFITPNIVGSQLSINPIVAILAFLLGGAIWGISGMILFVPFVAILKAFLDNIPALAPYGYLLSQGETETPSATTETDTKKVSIWQKMMFWKKK